MSAETDLYAALSGRAALTALVGARIYPDAIPEGDALPAIVYQRAGTVPSTTLGNVTLAEQVRFGITAWSETRIAADAVVGLHAVTIECDWWHTF
jgi:hypothetical protein